MNVTTIVMLGAGAILLYAGIKDVDPKTVISGALGNKSSLTATDKANGIAPSVYKPDPGTGTARV